MGREMIDAGHLRAGARSGKGEATVADAVFEHRAGRPASST